MNLALNLNRDVKVSLTQAGFQCACDAGFQQTATAVDASGYSTFQLWQLIEIFGKAFTDLDDMFQPFEILIDLLDLAADNQDDR